MHAKIRTVGTGVAAAIAAGIGYALFRRKDEGFDFDTIVRDGAFSVRRYPQLLVAETIEPGTRESALTRGVMALADFLDKARESLRLPKAVPLFADGDDDGRGWRTRFVLPSWLSAEALPAPGENVVVRTLEPRRLAAVRFSGEADDGVLHRREIDLRYWMETHGLRPAGPAEHVFYNPPFGPAPLRRSEVLIPLAA